MESNRGMNNDTGAAFIGIAFFTKTVSPKSRRDSVSWHFSDSATQLALLQIDLLCNTSFVHTALSIEIQNLRVGRAQKKGRSAGEQSVSSSPLPLSLASARFVRSRQVVSYISRNSFLALHWEGTLLFPPCCVPLFQSPHATMRCADQSLHCRRDQWNHPARKSSGDRKIIWRRQIIKIVFFILF